MPIKQVKVWTIVCSKCRQWVHLDCSFVMSKTRKDARMWLADDGYDDYMSLENNITDICGCERKKK